MKPAILVTILILLNSSPCPANESGEVIVNIDTHQPRDFGYVIGDTFQQVLFLEIRTPYVLLQKSLPRAGRPGLWLESRAPEVQVSLGADTTSYRIQVDYQIINMPVTPGQVFTPPITLEFVHDGDKVAVPFSAMAIDIVPITRYEADRQPLLSDLQPPLKPPRQALWPVLTRLGMAGLILVSSILYLLYLRFGLPWTRDHHNAFAMASRRIRALRDVAPEQRQRDAVRLLHHALNQTAGRSLFADDLQTFFSDHGEFLPVRTGIENLFMGSQKLFFGSGSDDPGKQLSYEACLQLCRECRAIERRST